MEVWINDVEIIERINHCIANLSDEKHAELDVTPDEFIKMGLKDKVIQILNK